MFILPWIPLQQSAYVYSDQFADTLITQFWRSSLKKTFQGSIGGILAILKASEL